MSHLTIIVATDQQGGIGIDNTLPWKLPEDLAHFKRLTTGHPILMGRKTFDSIGRPLPNRRNIVITRNPDWRHEGVEAVSSVEAAIALLNGAEGYVIGGAEIYQQSLALAQRLIITEIGRTFDCDAFSPPWTMPYGKKPRAKRMSRRNPACLTPLSRWNAKPDKVI